ncbi:MAG: RNA polymerase sigma factor [Anaerolineae bacterium]
MTAHTSVTDETVTLLVARGQRGEQAAVEQLYELYADRIYRYLLARLGDADLAADLTTEVFVRMIGRLAEFRLNPQRPAAAFSAWLYRIAANLALDHLRTRRVKQTALDPDLPVPDRAPAPEAVAEQRETLSRLAQAVQALSEEQRLVIIGKFVEEMGNAEVAAWLGKTEGAVKSLQHRALRTLGRLLRAAERSA